MSAEINTWAALLAQHEASNPMLAFVRRAWDAAEAPRREAWMAILTLTEQERAACIGLDFVALDAPMWFALCGAFMQENFDFFRLNLQRGFV